MSKPHSAVLGLFSIKKKAVVIENDEIVVRPMMNIALTYDHRFIDGKDSGLFMMEVKRLIENPERIMLEI